MCQVLSGPVRDLCPDIVRDVTGPARRPSVERFRFIVSPELAADINGGAAVGSTGLYSTGGSNIDVYPVIVVAEDAWGQVALRGMDSIDVTYLPPGSKDKNDPRHKSFCARSRSWKGERGMAARKRWGC